MGIFDISAALLSLAALCAYLNHRFLRMPTAIGLMVISLAMSLGLVAMGRVSPGLLDIAHALVGSVDFNETLMVGMLSFLLFAGAIHVDLADLFEQKWTIAAFATVGVLMSTFMVGWLTYMLFGLFHLDIGFIHCLLFGAVISPTDPIAVLGILKSAGAPKSLEVKITGESLFNDGVAVVVFIVLMDMATGNGHASAAEVAKLFAEEALGGIIFGLLIGYAAYRMLRSVDNYHVEILITLALVAGGYAMAMRLHVSGPIAMVVAGLMIGNHGRAFAMSETTREHLDMFWGFVDEVLNAILFVLIGLELLVLRFTGEALLLGVIAVPMALLCRVVSVGAPMLVLGRFRTFSPGALKVLTWGGLRGGISIALALSLPAGPERDILLVMAYVVVVFSILVQGLTLGRVLSRLDKSKAMA